MVIPFVLTVLITAFKTKERYAWGAYFLSAVLMFLFFSKLERHSVVEFRYSHEPVQRQLWSQIQPYVLVGLGGLFYTIGERIVKYFWP